MRLWFLITVCLLLANCSLLIGTDEINEPNLLDIKHLELGLENSKSDSFRKRVRDLALEEWAFFGKQIIENGSIVDKGYKETDEGYWQRVSLYWREGTKQNLTGKDTDWPWSAAFISWVMLKAGAESNFVYSIRHSDYIIDAISNKSKNKVNSSFLGFRLNEYPPQIGDLVCFGRRFYVTYYTPGPYPSHCDIVVDKNDSQISVVGGNVEDSITLRKLDIDSNGILIDDSEKWFVVIKNNLTLGEK